MDGILEGLPGLGDSGGSSPWPLAGGAGIAYAAPQLGLSAGLPSGLSLTRHSLDLKLARDLQLGMEAREPQRPNMEGVGSFPGERGWVRQGNQAACMWGGPLHEWTVKGQFSGHPQGGSWPLLEYLQFVSKP